MNIYDVVDSRQSIRDFHDKPVPQDLITKVLVHSLRSPSGGNLQPWKVHVVQGGSLESLKFEMRSKLSNALYVKEPEYDIYPKNLKSPYRERRYRIGEALYGQLGIGREDKKARHQWFLRNFEFFGAPLGLFFVVDREMGSPQWADLGMIMQTIMLLFNAEGVDTCAQECWALYPQTVSQFLNLTNDEMVFAGMSVGYGDRDKRINRLRTERAGISELVEFHS